jgi:hypothetical protein
MLPALILHGIITMAAILFIILAIIIKAILHAVLYSLLLVVHGYIFLVIFGLYRRFKRELEEKRRYIVTRI